MRDYWYGWSWNTNVKTLGNYVGTGVLVGILDGDGSPQTYVVMRKRGQNSTEVKRSTLEKQL